MIPVTGYRRPGGRVGIRNHVLIISSVVCANRVTQMIAEQVPGAVPLMHQHGCAQLGADREQTLRTLAGFGANPNVGASLVVGLGCETIAASEVAEMVAASGKPTRYLNIQDCGGTLGASARGAEVAARLAAQASAMKREPIGWDEIILAMECGGSDWTSGVAANPACGSAADDLVEARGTVILSETTEMIGAEHLLADRAETKEVAREIHRIVQRMEERAIATGEDIRGTQPTPGNIEGGLTTIEEKSLGCIYKAGTSSIREVVEYAHPPEQRGLVIMDTPGHDIESITGMVAGGSQLVIFTTGRGTPTGCPIAPVVKVTANKETAAKMADNIDIDCSGVIEGTESLESAKEHILSKCAAVINGQLTKAEALGHAEFALNRVGPSF